MKKAYSVIRKVIDPTGETNSNIFTSINQERVFEVFNSEVDDLFDWSSPDFQNEVLTAKRVENTEGWRQQNYVLVTDNANQIATQMMVIETPYKKRNLFFSIQQDDKPSIQKFNTLKEAKAFVENTIVAEKKIDHGTIVKYQEFIVDNDVTLYNTVMESPFTIKKGKVKYAKQIKHES